MREVENECVREKESRIRKIKSHVMVFVAVIKRCDGIPLHIHGIILNSEKYCVCCEKKGTGVDNLANTEEKIDRIERKRVKRNQ